MEATPPDVTVRGDGSIVHRADEKRTMQFGDHLAYTPEGEEGWELGVFLEQAQDTPVGYIELSGLTSTAHSRKQGTKAN